MRSFLLVALLTAPLFAGCFSDGAGPETQAVVAGSAEEAGAVDGPAPAAAKDPYRLSGDAGAEEVTVYPVSIQTNTPKPPYVQEFTGEYSAQQCTPGGELPLGGLGLAEATKMFDVAEAFAPNDVFSYDVTLTWTNTDQSWAELHLWHQFDGVGNYWSQPTSEGRGEIVLNFTGQGFIVNDEFFAMVGIDCWFGQITSPLAFRIAVTLTFAEGAVPSQLPVLVRVPEGATRLFASGLALDASRGVTSHFRVFAPDDSLVCECALNSNEDAAIVELADAGDYVVLVDHTENGFVSLALDAMPDAALRPLPVVGEQYPLLASDGDRAIDETLQVQLPSTPLFLWGWINAPGPIDGSPNAGAGHNAKIAVSNARGDVLRIAMVGFATYHAHVPGVLMTNDWYAVPLDGDWEFFSDHHAYDLGGHTVHVTAETLRGEAVLFAGHYDRAG